MEIFLPSTKRLPWGEYTPKAVVEGGRLHMIHIGCRQFRSFEQAFLYLTGGMKFKEWQAYCFPNHEDSDEDCPSCNSEYADYKSRHKRSKKSLRAPEVLHMWALQNELRRMKTVKFTVYRPDWMLELIKKLNAK